MDDKTRRNLWRRLRRLLTSPLLTVEGRAEAVHWAAIYNLIPDFSKSRFPDPQLPPDNAHRLCMIAHRTESNGQRVRALDIYLRARSFDDAARIAQKLRLDEQAMIFYEQAGMFSEAAETAAEIGDDKRERLYRSLSNLCLWPTIKEPLPC